MQAEIEKWKALAKKGAENRSREQGRLEMLMQQLKEKYDYDNVEDLEAEIEKIKGEIEEMEEQLKVKMEEFKNEYVEKLERAAQ